MLADPAVRMSGFLPSLHPGPLSDFSANVSARQPDIPQQSIV
jgi:hypothetical protein